jgi:hypothetical protein
MKRSGQARRKERGMSDEPPDDGIPERMTEEQMVVYLDWMLYSDVEYRLSTAFVSLNGTVDAAGFIEWKAP